MGRLVVGGVDHEPETVGAMDDDRGRQQPI
jgi:hypothetical protein